MDPSFFTPGKKYLETIAANLQKVFEKKITKLMISLPPRAGKSYTVSLFCAWCLGKNPSGSIMRNSYSQEIASKFSYDIREIVQKENYLAVFPYIKLKQDKAAVIDWALTSAKQTSYFCGGVGGSITGKGCDALAILDDPIKNIEDALSEVILTKTWQWYTSVHKARMEKDCPEIQIGTRWSKKDVIGKLLDLQPDDWKIINVPALDEEGNSFCEEIKSTEEYLELKKVTEDFIWEAEFMQKPIEAKGLLFPIEELNRFTMSELSQQSPDTIIGYTDTADEGTDFLCSVIGRIYSENIYITDVVFSQQPVEITEALVSSLIIETNCDKMIIESNAGGKGFARNIDDLIRNQSMCTIAKKYTTGNKETRILMKSGQIKKYCWFRSDYETGSQYDLFMRQFSGYLRFSSNAHDDAVDAVTGLCEMLRVRKVGTAQIC
jgi:predicted phage terminase large subunit-like protein